MWGNKMENSPAVVYENHMMAASGKQWFKKKKKFNDLYWKLSKSFWYDLPISGIGRSL